MRPILAGLFLTLVAVPAAQAQQFALSTEPPVSQPELPPIDAPSAVIQVSIPDAPTLQMDEVRLDVVNTKAGEALKVTTVLAVIGAVVVVVALVAFFS